jgi:hypothetical protein
MCKRARWRVAAACWASRCMSDPCRWSGWCVRTTVPGSGTYWPSRRFAAGRYRTRCFRTTPPASPAGVGTAMGTTAGRSRASARLRTTAARSTRHRCASAHTTATVPSPDRRRRHSATAIHHRPLARQRRSTPRSIGRTRCWTMNAAPLATRSVIHVLVVCSVE